VRLRAVLMSLLSFPGRNPSPVCQWNHQGSRDRFLMNVHTDILRAIHLTVLLSVGDEVNPYHKARPFIMRVYLSPPSG